MAKPISELSKDLKRTNNQLEKELIKMFKGATFAHVSAVIDATPVDTSKAVTNWRANIDVPATDVVGPGVSSRKGSAAQSARSKAKGMARPAVNALGLDRTLYITNNVPYIGLLNNGSPVHRPANMTRKGKTAFFNFLRGYKITLKP